MSTRPAPESVFTYGAPALKFGDGASDEIGYDLAQLGARRALVVTDPGVAATGLPDRVAAQMAQFGVEAVVFDAVHIEPTDASMQAAIDWARANGPWDALVAVGGGSSIDTAKAVNLLLTNPGELIDYVNAPVGGGRAPINPLHPLVAVPTTTGTGAESTTICVMDVLAQRVKSGISHARLRPTLAVVDPALTLTQPAGVTASAGMDILCHALESYTARAIHRGRAQGAGAAGAVLRFEPHLGHVVREGAFPDGIELPARGGPRRGPRSASLDGAGRDVRRPGLRQRRRAHPARQCLSDRGPGA